MKCTRILMNIYLYRTAVPKKKNAERGVRWGKEKDYSWQMTKKIIDRRKAEKQAEIDLYNSLCGPVTITYINK